MDIYVCGGNHVEKLCELCESLTVSKNIKREKLLTLPAKKSPASERSIGGEMNWRSFYT